MANVITILNLFFLVTYFKLIYSDCIINTEDISMYFPVILRDNYNDYTNLLDAIYLPEQNKTNIKILNGTSVIIACPGSYISMKEMFQTKVKRFKCQNHKFNGKYKLSDINCTSTPKPRFNKTNGNFEIGFQIEEKFLKLISGHFDNKYKITLFTNHRVVNSINTFTCNFKLKCRFVEPPFPQYSQCYTQNNQIKHIPALFNEPGRTKLTKVKSYFRKNCLTKGHLTPKGDFNFPYLRKATFYYHNIAPQWKQINSGNWKYLEEDVREMAVRHPNYVEVYTGTIGISKFFNKELFLYSKSRLPIPKFMWKVVIDPIAKKAIAFVMSNNPYDYKESSSFKCTNSCDDINQSHIRFSHTKCKKSYKKGCLYCCQVDNVLLESIPYLPLELIGYPLFTNF